MHEFCCSLNPCPAATNKHLPRIPPPGDSKRDPLPKTQRHKGDQYGPVVEIAALRSRLSASWLGERTEYLWTEDSLSFLMFHFAFP